MVQFILFILLYSIQFLGKVALEYYILKVSYNHDVLITGGYKYVYILFSGGNHSFNDSINTTIHNNSRKKYQDIFVICACAKWFPRANVVAQLFIKSRQFYRIRSLLREISNFY